MNIYVVQSYDRLCCNFNPYVIAFKKESDAIRQVDSYNHKLSTVLYGYVKVWLSEEVDTEQNKHFISLDKI